MLLSIFHCKLLMNLEQHLQQGWRVCLDSRPNNRQGMLYEQPQHEVTERYVSECSKPPGCCLGSGRCASCGRRSVRASAWPGPATAVPGNARPWRASGRGASAARPPPTAPSRPCPGTSPQSHASPAQHRANEVYLCRCSPILAVENCANQYLVLRTQSLMQELAGGCTIAFGVADPAHACMRAVPPSKAINLRHPMRPSAAWEGRLLPS